MRVSGPGIVIAIICVVEGGGGVDLANGAAERTRPPVAHPMFGQAACVAPDSMLTAAVDAVHQKQLNVGVTSAVGMGDEIVYRAALGEADIEQGVDVGHETRFSIASVTKLFTAVTLLRMVEEGIVDLDVPIREYVPTFPRRGENAITLRLLATHRAGLPHPSDRTPELFATSYPDATAAMAYFADEDLLFEPGTDRRYSSSNYNLIAAVLEAAGGVRFQELVSVHVLDALRLVRTGFDDVLRPLRNRTQRYSYYHPWSYVESDTLFVVPRWDYSFNFGGGNMYATATDVARFGLALVSPGLLRPESLEVLYSDDWFGSDSPSGGREILATGSNPGVQAGLLVRPLEELAVSVLANTWGKGSRSAEMVVDLPARLAEACLPD